MQIRNGVMVLGLEDVLLDSTDPVKMRLTTMLGLVHMGGETIVSKPDLAKLVHLASDDFVSAAELAEAIVAALDVSDDTGAPEPTPDGVLKWYLAWRGIELPAQPVVPWIGVPEGLHADLVKVAARRNLPLDEVILRAVARYIADDDVLWDAGID